MTYRQPEEPGVLSGLLCSTLGLPSVAQRRFSGSSPLRRLNSWASKPMRVRLVGSLHRLARGRLSIGLAPAQLGGAGALRAVALSTDEKDIARKACVDLLKLPASPIPAQSSGAIHETAAPAHLGGELGAVLDQIGPENHATTSGDPPA